MNPVRRRLAIALGAALVGLAATGGLFVAGFRVNFTPSYPVGLYRLQGPTWRKGDLVLVRLPVGHPGMREGLERGYVAEGFQHHTIRPLLKRVCAVEGDVIDVGDAVRVNGTAVPMSSRIEQDALGRPLPAAARSGVVPHGYVWILSDYNPRSYDSRYFGAVPAQCVVGRVVPLLTWK